MVWFAITLLLFCSMQITQCMEENKEMLIERQLKAMSDQQFEDYLEQKLQIFQKMLKEKSAATREKQNSQKSLHFLTCHQNKKREWVVENSEGGYLFENKERQAIISPDFLNSINVIRKSRPVYASIEDICTKKMYHVFATKKAIQVFSGCKGVIGVCECLDTNHLFQPHIEPQMGKCTCNKEEHVKK